MSPSEWITLGRISSHYGVRGWVKVHSYTEQKEGILDYRQWSIGSKRYRLEEGRAHGKGIVARLEGVHDRDAASPLIGQEIQIRRAELPALPEGEHYWADLEGLTVINREGETLGRVEYLFATGANDVLVVQGERERLLPFVPHVVLEVDMASGRMDVDWDSEF